MIVKKTVDFYDIRENAWGGATHTLDTIEDKGKEEDDDNEYEDKSAEYDADYGADYSEEEEEEEDE